jgi:hypothetical protein
MIRSFRLLQAAAHWLLWMMKVPASGACFAQDYCFRSGMGKACSSTVDRPLADGAGRLAHSSLQLDLEDFGDVKSAAISIEKAARILTIGHSTRPLDRFIAALRENGIERLIDIRTIPRSRHNPQFNREELSASLGAAGIAYEHRPGLGGLRHPKKDSPNGGWQNESFRGFADYMQTTAFAAEIEGLIGEARAEHVAIMCAEAVPWRCHRSLVADALSLRGVEVEHIMSEGHRVRHRLTPFARVKGLQLTYPPGQPELFSGPSVIPASPGGPLFAPEQQGCAKRRARPPANRFPDRER